MATNFETFFPYASLHFIACEPGQLLSTVFFMMSVKHHGHTWIATSHGISYNARKYGQRPSLKIYVYIG